MAIPTLPTRAELLKDPNPFFACWVICGLLAIIIPLIQWSGSMNSYYQSYGRYVEYENQQQNQNGNNDNNNNDNNGNYMQDCRWWQFKCRRNRYNYYMQNGGGSGDNDMDTPGWYSFIGGVTEEDRRFREEMGMDDTSSGALKFVYTWTLVIFIGILVYGGFALYRGRPANGIGVALVLAILSQFLLMMIILIGQGVLVTEGRELENSVYGWYGQTGVLIVYTCFWMILFCIGFVIAFVVRAIVARRREGAEKGGDVEEPHVNPHVYGRMT